jgi:hypothetical protein
MEKSLAELDKLQTLIHNEWAKYRQAIAEDKHLADVKTIYVNIKELQKEIDQLSIRIQNKFETNHIEKN